MLPVAGFMYRAVRRYGRHGKIQVYVRHALSFLHSVTHRGGRVLFLESLTTFGSTEILNKMLHELAEVLGAPNREGRCGKG